MRLLRFAALVAAATAAGAAVISIDLGSDFIKAAAVRPGSGIDIVLNEQSKRKSNNYIGYRGDDRFLGEDASNLAPRFPTQMYTFLNRVIGKPWSDEKARALLTDDWALPYGFVENENRSTIDLKNPDPAVSYTMEELLAQLLGYIRGQAEAFLEMPVQEAVIAIPSFFDMRQRQALVDAANLTGLTVHGLMHHTTAAALQYGVQRRGFGNQTVNLVVYDMGASRLEIGVYRFRPYNGTDPKVKTKDVLGAMDVLAIASDESLGGRTFDVRIARYLAKKFQEKTKIDLLGDTSKAARKAFTSLLGRANKVKEVLSANKEAPVQIEELFDGKPFFYQLTRDELDKECDDLFERSVPTLRKALAAAELDVQDITAFEIIGGGVRIPRLQTSLSEALGGRALDRTLNGDECIALGSAFHAAKLSGSFRTKGFVISEPLPYNISFRLSQLEGSERKPAVRPLITVPQLGVKKSITVPRSTDFSLEVMRTRGDEHEEIMTVHLGGVASTLESVGFNKPDKSENSSHSVQIQVKLTDEGLLRLTAAEVKFDDHVIVQRKIRVKEPKANASANATDNATSENATGGEKEKEKGGDPADEKKDGEKAKDDKEGDSDKKDEAKKDGEDEKEGEGDGKEAKKEPKKPDPPKYTYVNKTEVRKHRKPLTPEIRYVRPLPMSEADYTLSQAVLSKLQDIEDRKKETAKAKNDLETYLYWVKYEGVLDNEVMKEFTSEEDEKGVREAVAKCDEWMEDGDGSADSTPASDFKDQKRMVEAAVQPIIDKKKAKEDAEKKKKEEELKKKLEEEAAAKKAEEAAKAKVGKGEGKEDEDKGAEEGSQEAKGDDAKKPAEDGGGEGTTDPPPKDAGKKEEEL